METNRIELTPEQKDVLASLSQETGEPVSALIDTALEELQKHLRARRGNGTREKRQKEKAVVLQICTLPSCMPY